MRVNFISTIPNLPTPIIVTHDPVCIPCAQPLHPTFYMPPCTHHPACKMMCMWHAKGEVQGSCTWDNVQGCAHTPFLVMCDQEATQKLPMPSAPPPPPQMGVQ